MADDNPIIITVTDKKTQDAEQGYMFGLPWLSKTNIREVEKLSQSAWIIFLAAAGLTLTMVMLAKRA